MHILKHPKQSINHSHNVFNAAVKEEAETKETHKKIKSLTLDPKAVKYFAPGAKISTDEL